LGLRIKLPLIPVKSMGSQSNKLYVDDDASMIAEPRGRRSDRTTRNKYALAPESKADEFVGWIGLLGCSTGSVSELIGIPLRPTNSRNTANGVQRVQVRGHNLRAYQTIIVGPNEARKAKLREVTIVADTESEYERRGVTGFRQIHVTASNAFRHAGYHITAAAVVRIAPLLMKERTPPLWDHVQQTLTIEGQKRRGDLIKFDILSKHLDSERRLTLLLRTDTKKATICRGHRLARGDASEYYNYLDDEGVQQEHQVVACNGQRCQIVTRIREKKVYQWRLVEIEIDCRPVRRS
jgi:hypothetical protein